jgi:hypothetical protein
LEVYGFFFVDWKYTIETRDLKVSKRVFCILITSGTTGPIGYKHERNVHWIVLLCLVFLFDLKYIKINRRGKQGVFCFCMCQWSVYFSTNLLEVFFLYVPDTIIFFLLHTYFLWLLSFPRYYGVKVGPTPKIMKKSPTFYNFFRFYMKFPACIYQIDLT